MVEGIVHQATTAAVAATVRVRVTSPQRQIHTVSGIAPLRIIMVRVRATAIRMDPMGIVPETIMIKDMEVMKVRLIRLTVLENRFSSAILGYW